jgi:hypothetical protein
MVNKRNNCNGQGSNTNNQANPQIEQLIANSNQQMHVVMQTLQHLQPNPQQQAPPAPQSRLRKFLRTRPNTFSQAKDPMDAED